jgi:seipin
MYNWRLSSFVVFTSIFWGFELASMAVLWFGLSMFTSYKPEPPIKQETVDSGPGKAENGVKSEDTPAQIKQEEGFSSLTEYPTATEADIEDEDGPEPPVIVQPYRGASDSGIGTSLESSASRGPVARKRSSRTNLGDDR